MSGTIREIRVCQGAGFGKLVGGRFRWTHLVWAVLGLGASLLLVFGGGQGHPPAILFLPLVLVIWCLGHAALWGIALLAAKGRKLAGTTEGARDAWPPGLVVASVGTGVVAFLGLLQLVVTLVLVGWYPFEGVLWAVAFLIALAHAAGFVGILLRRAWARPTAAALSVGWGLLLAWQVVDQVTSGYRIDAGGVALALVGIALLSGLGIHLWTSRRIRAFVASD